jgi:hypothetical protein
VLATAAVAAVACGGDGSASASATPSPSGRVHPGSAVGDLLRLDELTLPGFTVASAPAEVDVAALSAGDSALASALASAGVRSAASARYFRSVPALATAEGPVDVTTTVLACGGPPGAATLLGAFAKHLDGVSGAIPVSTGPLGDGGHADVVEAVQDGVTVAQVTLAWRSGDLVSILVVRERNTGSPLADALIVARPQVQRLQG